MTRQLATAAEIQRAIYETVDALPEVEVDGERVDIPLPQLQEPHADGCNWFISGYEGPDNYELLVQEAVAMVRAKYNLKT
jgi:hypothetical protein